jgi:small GTP-binding protein
MMEVSITDNEETIYRIQRNLLFQEEELDLSGQSLKQLPKSIGELKHLKALYLGWGKNNLGSPGFASNYLRSLPIELFNLTNLEVLDISYNRFSNLSKNISKLENLKELNIESNYLLNFPSGISRLAKLVKLRLSKNRIAYLPHTIGNLTQLREIELLYNKITEIPRHIGSLINLNLLDLHGNQIESLPEEIGNCINLQRLYISENQLNWLPKTLENLGDLRILDLRFNKLQELPFEINKLNSLKKLVLIGNEIGAPSEVLENIFQPKLILNFYFQNVKPQDPNKVRPLNEIKMLLLGDGGVGKSSIARYLIERRKRNKNEETTEGIQRRIWYLPIRHPISCADHDLRIKIWDFGGQEIQHQTHQFFLTKRSFYLVVIDSRRGKDESRLEYWLKTAETYGGESPIIVVINKIDENPSFELDKKGLKRKYPNIRDFVFTSCETGKGIDELRRKIQHFVCEDELKEVFLPFNKNWRGVKDEIEKINKDSINFDDYLRICKQKKVNDSLSQTSLIDFLHDLGVILYYRHEQHLRSMGVINPSWVTEGVYKFVTDPQIKEAGGVMKMDDLDRLLTSPKYPEHKRPFILEMMKKYELVFSAGDNNQYLVTDLLPEEEPVEVEKWEEKSLLRFSYKYNFLSSNIISRFIVRTHTLIKNNLYWRRGSVLENESNFALVRGDLEEKMITIYVGGVQTTCRDFLSQIRGIFNGIHRELNNLVPEEFVTPVGYSTVIIKYRDLLAAEEAAEKDFFVPELKRRVSVTELLDGIENPLNRNTITHTSFQNNSDSMPKVFLSHSSKDKDFVHQIAEKLEKNGIEVWLDEDKIKVGDSILQKIAQGLQETDYILYVLSPNSVDSNWVREEFGAIMIDQIKTGKIRVLPLLYKDCEIPIFLRDKHYVDFRDLFKYETEFNKLLDVIKNH